MICSDDMQGGIVVSAVSATAGAPPITPGRPGGDDCAAALGSLLNNSFKIVDVTFTGGFGSLTYTLTD